MAVWRTLFFLGQDEWVLPAEALFYFFASTKRSLSSVDVRR
ncbi:hypothetical protein [Paenibacillus lautus]